MEEWRQFLRWLFGGLAGIAVLMIMLVAVMDPLGNLRLIPWRHHIIMGDNQRFQYPALIRHGRFDSIVLGTSSSRLLDPHDLERQFGGRFANLAMNSATAWEQYRLADLFLRTVKTPRTLFVGLDHVWCAGDADTQRITFRGFPEWLFDDRPWNDLRYMINTKVVKMAALQLLYRAGLPVAPNLGADGFAVFTPPEAAYDPDRARKNIWRGTSPVIANHVPAYAPSAAERAGWRFPAMQWLDDILERVPATTTKLLVFMPLHRRALPEPGSRQAARYAECKHRIAEAGARHGAHVIDFAIDSAITRADDNFWDRLHYRQPIAKRVVRESAAALETRRDDPQGEWRYLARP